jgi:hypothetical protein
MMTDDERGGPMEQAASDGRTAIGSFTVDSFDPQATAELDSITLGQVVMAKTFQGDLAGAGSVTMLSVRTPIEDSAAYVAIEKVVGWLDGRAGAFVLQHTGVAHGGERSATVTVVPDSATGELAGLRGRFHIDIDDEGAHTYRFAYTLSA